MLHLEKRKRLKEYLERVKGASYEEKMRFLQPFLPEKMPVFGKDVAKRYVLSSIFAIEEDSIVFYGVKDFECVDHFSSYLLELERAYSTIGGVIGYHLTFLDLLDKELIASQPRFFAPKGLDLSKETKDVKKAVLAGIANLPHFGEIYPVGGAGDRLQLKEDMTGEPLPAAFLQFQGIPLLEWLIRDIEAREYLYFKHTGEKIITPLALMTSKEKQNHERILAFLQEKRWFGRGRDHFFLFSQLSVPLITEEGHWVMKGVADPLLKPGGHGQLWQMGLEHGMFRWFEKKGRTKVLVRQINNPVAGSDHLLLGFAGQGVLSNKVFGFASCQRRVGAAEGMNVVAEDREGKRRLTCIEYTQFQESGLVDEPAHAGSMYSKFPANTNILFADLKAVENAARLDPLPGKTINMKNRARFRDAKGLVREMYAGRLETMMQGVADAFADTAEDLQSYLVYGQRCKTISVTKRAYDPEKSLLETPPGCFYEMLHNARELLQEYCHVSVPPIGSEREFLDQGPSFFFSYHPSLGPLYSIIAQKIQRGIVMPGSELVLEIADLELKDFTIDGSMRVFGCHGRLSLRGVSVKNQGVVPQSGKTAWKGTLQRKESLCIEFEGEGELIADNISFVGNRHIFVPAGERLVIR